MLVNHMLKIKIRNDFMIQEILNSIDQIDDITTEYTVSTMNSMIDSYEKSAIILENYEGDDLSSFTIFQEGGIMDDVKKQGQGQSTLMKILSFIPRLIKAIFHKIKKAISKGETPAAVNKELQKAPKEVKKALPILFDNKKDKKSKVSMIKKILIGAGAVGAAAVVGKKTMSKSKSDDDSSSSTNKVTEALTKLKNALKIRTKTKKKLEEAEQELQQSEEKLSKKDDNKIVKQPTVAGDIEKKNQIVKKLQEEVNDNADDIEKFIADCIEILGAPDESHLLVDDDQIDENLYNDIMTEIKKLGEDRDKRFQNLNLSKLIASLRNYESKKDAYYKDLDKEISKLMEIFESKHKRLASIYTTIKDCCHRIVDKCPVTPGSVHEMRLHFIDKSAELLESDSSALLKISRDGGEISLTENIDNCLTYVVSNINYTMHNIHTELNRPHNQDYKFDDSNNDFKRNILNHLTMMLNNTDLGPGTIYATKMIIDPVTKKARSEDNGRNKHSVFDNSLVSKSDFEEIETYFTEIKGSVEKINKERPEEIKERNIDNVMIYVSALVELAQHVFTFACGATNLVKEFVGRVADINKKYEGERNKLFNDKSE